MNNSFKKVLVANRGEIALRIMRTLRKMNIKSVAVYSEADSSAMHVEYADEAYYIGNSPSTESYLSIKNILHAIRISGADAVHPGYGFLSENPNFANALKREGITLIGPSAKTIKMLGDKIEAKKLAIEAGVNTVPGYIGSIMTPEQAIEIASEIGFPVIIKAAAGGGGRGMRIVNNADEMVKAYHSAKMEAENCFNNDKVFIEKYINKPRHIEIQLLADQYGNIVCLGERECSIQRYHQKIIEEAPSIFIDDVIRNKMYEQVVSLAKRVGYYSAGTVEFMVDNNKNFYFLEVNTRLQVEHRITEMITGYDIVEQMVNIAAHQKLSFTQEDVELKGWAIESRICAEDPARGFLPSSGRIVSYKEPIRGANVQVDSCVHSGSEVSIFYDPMIAKLCTYAEDRNSAIEEMKKGLSTFLIEGISHNINFLEALINHERFISGDIHTGLIDEIYPGGFANSKLTTDNALIFLATAVFAYITEKKRAIAVRDQINDQTRKIGTRWVVRVDDMSFPVVIKSTENGLYVRSITHKLYVESNWVLGSSLFTAYVNGQKVNVKINVIDTGYRLTYSGITINVYVRSPRVSELEALMIDRGDDNGDNSEVPAPLDGKVIAVKVSKGDKVKVGQELVVLTAMKMENTICAEKEGIISETCINVEDQVSAGDILVKYEE